MTNTTPSPTITEKDASHYIGLSVAYLRQARRQGRGPAYLRFGRAVRYRVADLDDWLAAHRVETRESRAS